MPVTSWHPERITFPVKSAFPAAARTSGLVARTSAPRGESGQLASHVRVTFTGTQSAILHVPGVPYAVPVAHGSKAHTIIAAQGSALVTPWGPRASVEHSGNPPNSFLHRGAAAFRPAYAVEVSKRMRVF